jgi:hypothetical protein
MLLSLIEDNSMETEIQLFFKRSLKDYGLDGTTSALRAS